MSTSALSARYNIAQINTEYLIFSRNNRTMAVLRSYIDRVIQFNQLRPFPGGKNYCIGVSSWEDTRLPVLDPTAMMGYEDGSLSCPSLGLMVRLKNGESWFWAADSQSRFPDGTLAECEGVELTEPWMEDEELELPHLLQLHIDYELN